MTKEILDKLSSYNLFNNLLPGTLFVYIVSKLTNFNLLMENNLIGAFFYYFIGIVISRLGTLIVEPVLKKIRFIKFTDYKDYIVVSKKDGKIDILSEQNNMFRTIISLFVFVLLSMLYDKITICFCIPVKATLTGLVIGLLILFLFSYRKQTNYIRKRIDNSTD